MNASNLACDMVKRSNKALVEPLNRIISVAPHPSFHSNPHECINAPLMCVHYVALCGSKSRKPSVYAGVQRINSPLTPIYDTVGGVGGVVTPLSATDSATRNF